MDSSTARMQQRATRDIGTYHAITVGGSGAALEAAEMTVQGSGGRWRGTHHGVAGHGAGKAKVAQLDGAVGADEDVLRLHVPAGCGAFGRGFARGFKRAFGRAFGRVPGRVGGGGRWACAWLCARTQEQQRTDPMLLLHWSHSTA